MLADEVSRMGGLMPMTDQTAAHTMIGAPIAAIPAVRGTASGPDVDDIRDRLAMLAVRTVVPAHLADIPIAEIIKLRRRYRDDFDAFTTEIDRAAEELAVALQAVTDPQALRLQLQDTARERFAQPTKRIQRVIRSAGHDTMFSIGSWKVELPTLATAVPGVAALAAHHTVAAATVSVALLAFTTRRAARKSIEAAMQPSAASYLLRVQDGLTPRSLLGQVRRAAHQLIGVTP
jgi:hypothetical protein